MCAIVSNPDPSDELPAIEHTSVIQGSVRRCSLKRSCFTASEIFTKSSRKMNGCPCPHSGPLLKEGVDREVKAGENFKHPLAQGPPGSLQLTPEWKESRAKWKRSLARWYTSIIISRSPPFFFSRQGWPTLHPLAFRYNLFHWNLCSRLEHFPFLSAAFLKGNFTQKWEFCHNFFTLMHPHIS